MSFAFTGSLEALQEKTGQWAAGSFVMPVPENLRDKEVGVKISLQHMVYFEKNFFTPLCHLKDALKLIYAQK